jgi:uncharacterized membrane protein YjjP (DUF1212 family)
MLSEIAIRFFLGGFVVSMFAALSDVLKPKTFSGVFGAAPSVALASLFLSYNAHGATYVSTEGRSMIAGAAALFVYSVASAWAVRRNPSHPWVTTLLLWSVWLVVAFGLWRFILRS